jgi:hypothetical protein
VSGLGTVLVVGAGALLALGWAAASKVVSDEVAGSLPYVARKFVLAAARKLPLSHQARYEAEWLGELASLRERRIAGLVFAIGVWRRAPGTAMELDAATPPKDPRVPVAVGREVDLDAAISFVKRLVERTEPEKSNWDIALEAMRKALEQADADVGKQLAKLAEEYLEDVAERRRNEAYISWQARYRDIRRRRRS